MTAERFKVACDFGERLRGALRGDAETGDFAGVCWRAFPLLAGLRYSFSDAVHALRPLSVASGGLEALKEWYVEARLVFGADIGNDGDRRLPSKVREVDPAAHG